jgi:hypothetical protein
MSEICQTGSDGERLLAEYLLARGRKVEPSDNKTFDFIVDGRYAEVKSSRGPYAKLGFVGLTDAQRHAMHHGPDFTLFVVCNTANPEALEVLEIPATSLALEEPKVECTHYWYRSQLERCRREPNAHDL